MRMMTKTWEFPEAMPGEGAFDSGTLPRINSLDDDEDDTFNYTLAADLIRDSDEYVWFVRLVVV